MRSFQRRHVISGPSQSGAVRYQCSGKDEPCRFASNAEPDQGRQDRILSNWVDRRRLTPMRTRAAMRGNRSLVISHVNQKAQSRIHVAFLRQRTSIGKSAAAGSSRTENNDAAVVTAKPAAASATRAMGQLRPVRRVTSKVETTKPNASPAAPNQTNVNNPAPAERAMIPTTSANRRGRFDRRRFLSAHPKARQRCYRIWRCACLASRPAARSTVAARHNPVAVIHGAIVQPRRIPAPASARPATIDAVMRDSPGSKRVSAPVAAAAPLLSGSSWPRPATA